MPQEATGIQLLPGLAQRLSQQNKGSVPVSQLMTSDIQFAFITSFLLSAVTGLGSVQHHPQTGTQAVNGSDSISTSCLTFQHILTHTNHVTFLLYFMKST